ncbi:MAG: alpha/beta hydrolase [Bacilli bacterium]|nr:alpha/beta hydrolase [Bacilli bacterium]
MFERIKAKILFEKFLGRPDISLAYKKVGEDDPWYETINKVHASLEKILKLDHKVLEIHSEDGYLLKGIYYPCVGSKKTVICIHGYTSHAEREWAFNGLFYHELGYNVLIPYQRAHGISEGKYITFGALESKDSILWAKKIDSLVEGGEIIFHGLSMGGGVLLNLCDLEINNVKGLIIDAPSISISNFFDNVSKEFFKRKSDKIAYLCKKRFNEEFGVDIEDYNGLERVKSSRYPILLARGENEELQEYFDEIVKSNPNKTKVVVLKGCDHGNGMYKETEVFQSAIKEFLTEVM